MPFLLWNLLHTPFIKAFWKLLNSFQVSDQPFLPGFIRPFHLLGNQLWISVNDALGCSCFLGCFQSDQDKFIRPHMALVGGIFPAMASWTAAMIHWASSSREIVTICWGPIEDRIPWWTPKSVVSLPRSFCVDFRVKIIFTSFYLIFYRRRQWWCSKKLGELGWKTSRVGCVFFVRYSWLVRMCLWLWVCTHSNKEILVGRGKGIRRGQSDSQVSRLLTQRKRDV